MALLPRQTPKTKPYPILIGLSRLRIALLCLDASSFGKQPLRAGDAASAASEAWPQAGDAGMPPGCFPELRSGEAAAKLAFVLLIP